MSRYGHEEVIVKSKERPYPPILEFVPPPPSPSAASSGKLVQKTTRDDKKASGECGDQSEQLDEDSSDYYTDDEDKESLPGYPYDINASCLRAKCKGGEEETDGEESTARGKSPWTTKKTQPRAGQMVDVQTRLSDISIHEEEYQAALSAGKIHLRGKGQQLYEPVLGEVSPEADRIGFHFFLKKTGVLSIIARSMLALYDEPNMPPPEDGIEYLINSVGYKLTIRDTITELQNYKESLLVRYQRLSVENDWLHRAMDVYEATELDINGRQPNPYNRLEYPADEYDFAYDEATYGKLRKLFSRKQIPSKEEQELSYGLENSLISLEEFDEAMKHIDPHYLDLTDVSSEEEAPPIQKVQTKISFALNTTGPTTSELGVSASDNKSISPANAIANIKSPNKEDPRKTVATLIKATQGIKPSVMAFKVPKRRMTIRSDEATSPHKIGPGKLKESRKLKRRNLKESPSATHLQTIAASANKEVPVEDYSENLLNQHSLVKLYDPEEDKVIQELIAEEEEDIKRPIQWFHYDYEEDGFKDLCGFGTNSESNLQSNKTGDNELNESDGEEQMPIVHDTSDDDTGMENIKPEVYGHLDTQTVVGDFAMDSDEDREFTKDYDYQEPELSSDEEIFGRKRKFSTAKFKMRRPDSSGEEDEVEPKFVGGDDQLIDVMEMEPIVPYSSDEDEIDLELIEPPCYEFPVTRTKLPTYSHSYRQS